MLTGFWTEKLWVQIPVLAANFLTKPHSHQITEILPVGKWHHMLGNFISPVDDWITAFTHPSKFWPVSGEQTSTSGQPCPAVASGCLLQSTYPSFQILCPWEVRVLVTSRLETFSWSVQHKCHKPHTQSQVSTVRNGTVSTMNNGIVLTTSNGIVLTMSNGIVLTMSNGT